MRISRLFTAQTLEQGLSIVLDKASSHYLSRVLRLKTGQTVTLFNGLSPHDYLAEIIQIDKAVTLNVISCQQNAKEPELHIAVYQALSKNEHMDIMLQKCTELGVSEFHIFNSERTQIPLKSSKLDKKYLHWSKVIQSACEQCGRSLLPKVHFHSKFTDLQQLKASPVRLMLDFEGESLSHMLNAKQPSIDIILGAEGGLTKTEIKHCMDMGFKAARLGPRVLRTETAAISAVSLVQMLAGDLN